MNKSDKANAAWNKAEREAQRAFFNAVVAGNAKLAEKEWRRAAAAATKAARAAQKAAEADNG